MKIIPVITGISARDKKETVILFRKFIKSPESSILR